MSELREILAESVSRLFADHLTKARLDEAQAGHWTAPVWDALVDNGITRALVAEGAGGAGATFEETFAIAYAAGRVAAPLPLVETLAAGWLLARAGIEPPPGPCAVADAVEALAAPEASPSSSLPSLSADGQTLSATLTGVPWGRHLEHLVVPVEQAGVAALGLVRVAAAAQIRVHANQNLAGEPRDQLELTDAPVLAVAPISGDPAAQLPRLLGAMMRSAQMAGAAGWVLDTTLQYANDRVQFGRPLGKLQSIQHYLATLASRVAQATMASEIAFRALDRYPDDLEVVGREIATAKVVVGDAAWAATNVGHQVHGAIGFTAEYELHYRTRRLWCWRAEHGSEAWWAERLGREAIDAGHDALWPNMTTP